MTDSEAPRSPFAGMADLSARGPVRVLSADEIEQTQLRAIVLSTSIASTGPGVYVRGIGAAGNGSVMASGSPRSNSGETATHWSCRIGSGSTVKNGGMSHSQLGLSGCGAASAGPGPISSARASSMGLPAVAGWQSFMEPGPTAFAVIVIGSRMPRSAKIAMTGHCGGRIIFACGLAGSPVLRRLFLLGQKACTAGLTPAFNPRY